MMFNGAKKYGPKQFDRVMEANGGSNNAYGERRATTYKDVATPNILLAYHTPASRHPDYYALDLLSGVLSSGNSSRLVKSLVLDSTIASSFI